MNHHALYFVVPGDLETRTGGYGYDRQIISGLRARGWTVEVVSLPGTYPFPTRDEQDAASSAFAAIPDDACVVVDGLAFGVLPDVAAREKDRLRLIALVHHPLGLETGLHAIASELLLAAEGEALAAARGVVVTSARTVDAVVQLGVPRSRIIVVEPGTEPSSVATGSSTGTVHLLCVASLTPRKGHDVLLDALERLLHLDWRLTLVGNAERDSGYAAMLMARIDSGALAGRITLTGELDGAPLGAAYAAADLFVLPTRYEGYGMVVAEALARGIPVVSTPTGAVAELVGDAAGVLVPAGDAATLASALERLITDREALDAVRAGALRVRSTLPTWADAAARMEEAIVRLAAS